jgi:hypothetical protein
VPASIEASNNGSDWAVIWENDSGAITANSWSLYSYDISAVADGQATVYIRWGHEVLTDGTWAYSGWNIDDVEIMGVEVSPPCAADLDGTGEVDVTDLLTLLASWGEDGPGAEIAEPFDVADVSDLLTLLAAWGACP